MYDESVRIARLQEAEAEQFDLYLSDHNPRHLTEYLNMVEREGHPPV